MIFIKFNFKSVLYFQWLLYDAYHYKKKSAVQISHFSVFCFLSQLKIFQSEILINEI